MSLLNLARKFRVDRFEDVKGQSLVVRMLKNSLYLDRLFPVYLFFGQHGCGKTSIARIFAMAINCERIELFRTSPKEHSIPCMECDSCQAMRTHGHPDFIEIDAASYTGVDNIRNIIEVASYLPVMGRKKIYLIDEAHMLSKAAFNALLKILEEPPTTVLFMLATTDVEKIIETVRSRCFQLVLQPVTTHVIVEYLTELCAKEGIQYTDEGLWAIAGHANGSVRDALNIVERVRCAYASISSEKVEQVLGYVSDRFLYELFSTIYVKEVHTLVTLLASSDFTSRAPEMVWKHSFHMLRAAWYLKQQVEVDEGGNKSIVAALANDCSADFLAYAIGFLYAHESHFLKTHTPRFFLEHLFICMSERQSAVYCAEEKEALSVRGNQDSFQGALDTKHVPIVLKKEEEKSSLAISIEGTHKHTNEKTTLFLEQLELQVTPLIYSLFVQATFEIHTHTMPLHVVISFPHSLMLLQEAITESAESWAHLFKGIFGKDATHEYRFVQQNEQKKTLLAEPTGVHKEHQATEDHKKNTASYQLKKNGVSEKKEKENKIDISDSASWPQLHMVLSYFPGVVTRIE